MVAKLENEVPTLPMNTKNDCRRYIFHTHGVCPPEIHFQLDHRVVEDVRFVGGGCPGNARLVSRLIRGKTVDEILPILNGIDCREKSSCPDQLAMALESAVNGNLLPADTIRIKDDPIPRQRVGLIGSLNGDPNILETIISSMQSRNVEAAYCIGNFTGEITDNRNILRLIRRHKQVNCILGARDRLYASLEENSLLPLASKYRDWIAMLPHLLTFRMGNRKAVAFYGNYLQDLPGYSDFSPYSLEINMICGLTDFMRDETVFPALEAMIPQFQADFVLFGQSGDWGRWRIGGKEFVSLGLSEEAGKIKWGFLETTSAGMRLEIVEETA